MTTPSGGGQTIFPDGSKVVATSSDGVTWTYQVWKSAAGAFPPGYQGGNAGAFPNAEVMN